MVQGKGQILCQWETVYTHGQHLLREVSISVGVGESTEKWGTDTDTHYIELYLFYFELGRYLANRVSIQKCQGISTETSLSQQRQLDFMEVIDGKGSILTRPMASKDPSFSGISLIEMSHRSVGR